VMDVCRNQKPPLVQMGEDHQVACFLYCDEKTSERPAPVVRDRG
jgi:hypothetical protein